MNESYDRRTTQPPYQGNNGSYPTGVYRDRNELETYRSAPVGSTFSNNAFGGSNGNDGAYVHDQGAYEQGLPRSYEEEIAQSYELDHYDDQYRSVGPAMVGPSIGTLDFGNPMQNQRWEPKQLDFGIQQFDPRAFQKGGKYEIAMAQPNSYEKQIQFPTGSQDPDFYKEEMSDDEEQYEGEMQTEEDMVVMDKYNISTQPLPENYKRNSTFVSTASAIDTLNEVELVLKDLPDKVQYTRDAQCSKFEGNFYSGVRPCEFVVDIYAGSIGTGVQETWVGFVNHSTGTDSHQAFSEFLQIVTEKLQEKGIVSGLVDKTYFPLTGLETTPMGSDDVEDDANVSEDAMKRVIQERINALNQCNFAGAQKELLNELSYLEEGYPETVAAAKDAAPTLAKLLKKNATSDYQLCRVALQLVRTLLDNRIFASQLDDKLPKALIKSTLKVTSKIWQDDLVRTVIALEKAGIVCKARKLVRDEQYRQIRNRLEF